MIRGARRWNLMFDGVVRTRVGGRRNLPAFPVCGAVGLLVAACLAAGLTGALRLSFAVTAGAFTGACISFLALAMATKILTGEERLVFFRHQIAALLAFAGVIRVAGAPLLPYLDIAALGVGVFLVSGRAGCLMVGCCHGLPCMIGPRYGTAHTAEGFPAYLEGVRLFPLQVIDAAAALAGVLAGLLLLDSAPGAAFASCTGLYAAARFHLESLRGEIGRRRLRLTEAQWTSLLQLLCLATASQLGLLPPFVLTAAMAALAATLVIEVCRRPDRLLGSEHVREIAYALRRSMTLTTRGILLSRQTVHDRTKTILVHTVSDPGHLLTPGSASRLAALISRLHGVPENPRIVAGGNDTYHILLTANHEKAV